MNTILSKVEGMMAEQMAFISQAISLGDTKKKATHEEILKTLKLIKADLIKANNAKEYTLKETEEIKVLIAMVEQRNKSIKEYKNGGREDLAAIEQNEIELIYKIAPMTKKYFDELPKDDDIENYARECLLNYIAEMEEGYKLSMRDMSPLVKAVKSKYPNANGNIIKKVLQENI